MDILKYIKIAGKKYMAWATKDDVNLIEKNIGTDGSGDRATIHQKLDKAIDLSDYTMHQLHNDELMPHSIKVATPTSDFVFDFCGYDYKLGYYRWVCPLVHDGLAIPVIYTHSDHTAEGDMTYVHDEDGFGEYHPITEVLYDNSIATKKDVADSANKIADSLDSPLVYKKIQFENEAGLTGSAEFAGVKQFRSPTHRVYRFNVWSNADGASAYDHYYTRIEDTRIGATLYSNGFDEDELPVPTELTVTGFEYEPLATKQDVKDAVKDIDTSNLAKQESVSREIEVIHNAVVGELYADFSFGHNYLSEEKLDDNWRKTSAPIHMRAGQTITYVDIDGWSHKICRLAEGVYNENATLELVADAPSHGSPSYTAPDDCIVILECEWEEGVGAKDNYTISSPTDVIDVAIATNRDVEAIDEKVVNGFNKTNLVLGTADQQSERKGSLMQRAGWCNTTLANLVSSIATIQGKLDTIIANTSLTAAQADEDWQNVQPITE